MGCEAVKYRQQVDGEWVKPTTKGYLIKCCDCGLVHRLDFKVLQGRVIYRATRLRK